MYKIIVDSCGELTEDMKTSEHFANVALSLEVNGRVIIDDEDFDQASFLEEVAKSEESPKSACPSPNAYLEEIEGDAKRVYIVTLSSQLSGSYNSAVLAKELYEEDNDDENNKMIHVFDSKSASIGQTLIALKIAECEEANMSFEDTITCVDEYIAKQHTFFVLETLETLRKAGRLSDIKAMIATTLNIKPIMGSTDIGSINQLSQTRGMIKALDKMVELMEEVTDNMSDRILAISHCNCRDRAEALRDKLEEKFEFKDIIILDTAGVSSMYANDGGIIMVV